MKVEGKVAIITGGTRGIGRAFAEKLVRRRAKVCLIGRTQSDGDKACDELNAIQPGHAIFVQADISFEKQFNEAFEETIAAFGKVNIVCNNAGIAAEANWKRMINVNYNGTVIGTYLGGDYIEKFSNENDKGVIINVSSTLALQPFAYAPVYNGTKAAIIAFTRSCAELYRMDKKNVRINCACPHIVETSLVERLQSNDLFHLGEFFESEKDAVAMSAADIAQALMILIDDDTKNGEVLTITPQATEYYTFAAIT